MSPVLNSTVVGPVTVGIYNWTPQWKAASDPNGFRSVSYSGTIPVAAAVQLSELVANKDRQQTIGGQTGVLEYISSDASIPISFNGWHLLTGFTVQPYRVGAAYADVTLDAIHLGY